MPAQKPADAPELARQVEALGAPVTATPVETALAVETPAAVTDEAEIPAKDPAVSDASGQDVEDGDDMDWLEVRGRRRSHSRSGEGRGTASKGPLVRGSRRNAINSFC